MQSLIASDCKVNGLNDAAETMWHRAKSLQTSDGKTLIGWPSSSQTPTVWASWIAQLAVLDTPHEPEFH